MSIDNNNSKCVKSKYFSGQTAMDESLSDFQEVKQRCNGPKPAQRACKLKSKKVTKQIKGQKDIRTALKGKKNELLAYSKDFDTVCKKSGLDIDPEQLQLAIALSRSLQTESTSNSESSQTTSDAQDRVTKIRKTLQEYGFKVPEAKITINKRCKKHKKEYKLLTISEIERQQNITKKYSQILFENIDQSTVSNYTCNNQDSNSKVFNIATNTLYECIKDNNIFYIDNLLEKSTSSGSLLRDWSEIPGRPNSPNLFETNRMNFKDIQCSQDELDVILSGTMKSIKGILRTKAIEIKSSQRDCDDIPKLLVDNEVNVTRNESVAECETMNSDENLSNISVTEIKSQLSGPFQMNSPDREVFEVKSLAVLDVEAYNTNKFIHRSCSPDIFDDELSSIMEISKPINAFSQDHQTKVFTEDNFMDLTQCANVLSQNVQKCSQSSQNMTKRKSNDFMEITECIVGSSQPLCKEYKQIDLTQSPVVVTLPCEFVNKKKHGRNADLHIVNKILKQPNNDYTYIPRHNQNMDDEENKTIVVNRLQSMPLYQVTKDDIDLTQSSNEEDNKSTIEVENYTKSSKNELDSMDLTQSSNSSNHVDDLPFVDITNSQTGQSLDETMIVNEEEYLGANGKVKKSLIVYNNSKNLVFDLTQEGKDASLEHNTTIAVEKNSESCSNSFIKEFVHDHSENRKDNDQYQWSNEHNNSFHSNMSKEAANIDLTQGLDISEEYFTDLRPTTSQNIPNNSSLGKRDDVSIDYDEILIDNNYDDKDNDGDNESSFESKCNSPKTKTKSYNDLEIVDDYDCAINSSQSSDVFKLSDRELDYSMHKSRHDVPRDNFDFGGISVLDNLTKHRSKSLNEQCNSSLVKNTNITIEDSFLPEVNVKNTENKVIDKEENSDLKLDLRSPGTEQNDFDKKMRDCALNTPTICEYIIKTDNVTPMADYASMSTPQRNRELDKYGLKSFKRKRAIQILTHLYNSTHPTMQQIIESHDHPSPSKRPRHDSKIQSLSQKNQLLSPRISPSKETRLETNVIHASLEELLTSPRKVVTQRNFSKSTIIEDIPSIPARKCEVLGMVTKDVCGYEVTEEVAVIKTTYCNPDDWVFQKREKAKIHSCRVPLHIAFHNYVLSRRSLREAILKYEPVNIDVIHKDLVVYGHRYDPKDLLKFLDKKCITVKTTDNNSRNNKR